MIIAIFIFIASTVFLYIKARQGPGPYVFPTVFACLCVDTTMTLDNLTLDILRKAEKGRYGILAQTWSVP